MKSSLFSRFVPLLAAVIPGSVFGVINCYIQGGYTSCCQSYSIECETELEGWLCPQTSDSAGYSVTTVVPANQGVPGYVELKVIVRGTCEMTNTTCGETPGSCVAQPPVPKTCADIIVVGVIPQCVG